jgi:glucoamylase
MVKLRDQSQAFGTPGISPRWTHANKEGIGTAYFTASQIWFTVWNGIVTKVYYPTVDRSQVRDLQYLITDGQSFFHDEKRDLNSKVERMCPHSLGYQIFNTDPQEAIARTDLG